MAELYLALDVGGTYIKAGIVDSKGNIINNSITKYNAMSKESSTRIFSNMVSIIKSEAGKAADNSLPLRGIGFAFPGPFDYKNGICLIKGIDKYESIYGMNIRNELEKLIVKDDFLSKVIDKPYRMVFENDAALFALGEYKHGKAKGCRKIICVAIGTGCGSAFIDDGVIIKNRDDVPRDGVLYHLAFKDSIVDDYISARGIAAIYKMQNGSGYHSDIRAMAEEARNGNRSCKRAFETLGDMLGEVLTPHIEIFKPDCLILGGQISNSYDLFENSLAGKIDHFSLPVFVSDDTSASTIKGIADLLININA